MQEEGRGARGAPDHICIFFYLSIHICFIYISIQAEEEAVHTYTYISHISLCLSHLCLQTNKENH